MRFHYWCLCWESIRHFVNIQRAQIHRHGGNNNKNNTCHFNCAASPVVLQREGGQQRWMASTAVNLKHRKTHREQNKKICPCEAALKFSPSKVSLFYRIVNDISSAWFYFFSAWCLKKQKTNDGVNLGRQLNRGDFYTGNSRSFIQAFWISLIGFRN